ncbi:hypothetical protein FACS1894145_1160 [Bacteroidia bacterium]|nr:hypothetical protein FACS1894145_1160 [Bacteroidia bacterium]
MCKYNIIWTYRKQIVVLLGAGAAIPWEEDNVFTAERIKNIFLTDSKFGKIGEKTVGQYLFDILEKYYQQKLSDFKKEESEQVSPNFETFIAILEDMMTYKFGETDLFTSLIPSIFKTKEEIDNFLNSRSNDDIIDLYYHYIQLITNEIDKYNKRVLTKSKQNKLLLFFVKFFLDKGYSIKFYTTNYDDLIPQILLESQYKDLLYEGFNNGYFNFDLNRFKEAPISHFNLHGSIFLRPMYMEEKNRESLIYNKKSKSIPLRPPNGAVVGNPFNKLPSSPIITGYNKTQRIVNEPFNLGFNAFVNDINSCCGLLTVGYSFSDPHINSILSSFTNWDKVKFVNIDLLKRNFDAKQFLKDFNLYNVTEMEKGDEDEDWFHDKSGKKHIYKQGFKKFLEDNKSSWKFLC